MSNNQICHAAKTLKYLAFGVVFIGNRAFFTRSAKKIQMKTAGSCIKKISQVIINKQALCWTGVRKNNKTWQNHIFLDCWFPSCQIFSYKTWKRATWQISCQSFKRFFYECQKNTFWNTRVQWSLSGKMLYSKPTSLKKLTKRVFFTHMRKRASSVNAAKFQGIEQTLLFFCLRLMGRSKKTWGKIPANLTRRTPQFSYC